MVGFMRENPTASLPINLPQECPRFYNGCVFDQTVKSYLVDNSCNHVVQRFYTQRNPFVQIYHISCSALHLVIDMQHKVSSLVVEKEVNGGSVITSPT